MVVMVALVVVFVSNRYLRAKCLLLEASLVIPVIAMASRLVPRRRWPVAAFVVWLAGDLAALGQLARPGGFHVVDQPDHDRLAGALARVPPGSLLALDGFGAPADVVHDEHRAMRAAHAHGLSIHSARPRWRLLQTDLRRPGRSRGTRCGVGASAGRARRLSAAATSSNASGASPCARWTSRTRVPCSARGLRPTVGCAPRPSPMAPSSGGEKALAAGTVRAVTQAWCGRLAGEVRSVNGTGSYSVTVNGTLTATDVLTPIWTPFRTGAFSSREAVPVEVRAFVAAPDDAHVIALRRLAFVADPLCLNVVAQQGEGPRDDLFPDVLSATNTYVVGPAIGVHCGTLVATIKARSAGAVVVGAGSDGRSTSFGPGRVEASSLPLDFRRVSSISIRRVIDGDPGQDWRVLGLRVRPEACQDESP